jgi:hypothetical protein
MIRSLMPLLLLAGPMDQAFELAQAALDPGEHGGGILRFPVDSLALGCVAPILTVFPSVACGCGRSGAEHAAPPVLRECRHAGGSLRRQHQGDRH